MLEVGGLRTGDGPYTGPDTDTQLRALRSRERLSERQIYTGPDTSSQLIALRHDERLADEQAAAAYYADLDAPGRPVPTFHPAQQERRQERGYRERGPEFPPVPEFRPDPRPRHPDGYRERAPELRPVPEFRPVPQRRDADGYRERAPELRPAPEFRPAPEVRPVPQRRDADGYRERAPELRPEPESRPVPRPDGDDYDYEELAPRRREGILRRAVRDVASVPLPLYAVLGVQAVLSLRLIWSNSVFLDEGTYIWAGHIELWSLTSNLHVPLYSTFFSGAPVIYPPLAAAADSIGGLAAARLLSLGFMLGVTCMLWGTARSLFGQRAALSAVALFAIIGSTQFLGALATYDAMGLFLLTVAARLVVAVRAKPDSSLLLIAVVIAMVAANATKYATGIFDPVIVALAVVISPRGIKAGLGRAGYISALSIGLITALLTIGGAYYLAGLQFSTLSRKPGTASASLILGDSARWVGPVVAIAVLAIAVAWWRDRGAARIMIVLAMAGLLVPLNQARIHTTVSLLKHVDFGAWFACIAAGYAIAALTRVSRRAWIRGAVAVAAAAVIIVPAGAPGRAQAQGFEEAWPDTTQINAVLSPLISQYPGVYLAEDPQVFGYTFRKQVSWRDWADTQYFYYKAPGSSECTGGTAVGVTGATALSSPEGAAISKAIANQYFSLIVLNFGDTAGLDKGITAAIHRYGTYHLVADQIFRDGYGAGKFLVWAAASRPSGGSRGTSC
jgi:hypothetical protein